MRPDHGSAASPATIGVITALMLNGMLVAGILLATHFKSDAIAAQATMVFEVFQCRYVEDGRLHQIESEASDWQDAEEQICGAHYRDVRVPPLLARGYSMLVTEPGNDPILKAQRESCSCSQGDRPPILQDIGIVEAPMLGTKPKQKALPRIVNNALPTERNAVNPDQKVEDQPRRRKRKKERKREPDINALLDATSNFDPARPSNTDEAVGSVDGSRTSTSSTGRGDPFLQKVKARLDNAMNAPSSIPKSELKKLKAKIWVKIGPNGRLWKWDFSRRSGNDTFDSMIERTMKRFAIGGDQSFPPPTDRWSGKHIQIRVDGSKVK